MDQVDHFYSDEVDLFHPPWLERPNGFIDFRSKEAEAFNNILYTHLPDRVTRCDCFENFGCVFELKDLVLNVENVGVDPIHVRVTTPTMPRAIAVPSILTSTSDVDGVRNTLEVMHKDQVSHNITMIDPYYPD
jgi:hypothetical protein